MENIEYYTPIIEEFHVGFEFLVPIYGSDKFVEETFMLKSIENLFDKDENGKFNLPDCFRVKYLDREDIESLGWEPDTSSGDFTMYHLNSSNKYDYSLSFNGGYKRTENLIITIKYYDNILFKGTIKNKSELNKLMEQLGI
jgi:hypothetical protein